MCACEVVRHRRQGADGVLAVVERNLSDDQSVLLFLEDAGHETRLPHTGPVWMWRLDIS